MKAPTYHTHLRACLLTALIVLPTVLRLPAEEGIPPQRILGVDGNNNGLSDVYESLYSGIGTASADADGDGQTNRQESAAGTNPKNPSDRLDFSEVANEIAGIRTGWAAQPGKQYQLQTAATLSGPWVNEGAAVTGAGTPLASLCPRNGNLQFMRLQVTDIDTDADGVTDWEEVKAGTDRLLADSDGDGRTDMERILGQLALQNRINVTTPVAQGTEAGGNSAVFQFTRSGNLNPVTVSYLVGGTAVSGEDYAPLSGIVIFPIGVNTATVTVTPINDGVTEATETLILSTAPGAGYAIGTMSSATAFFTDARPGLLARYYNTQESVYPVFPATNENFKPSQLKLTRVDGAVDFDWGAGPPAGTGLTNPDSWSIRWEGQLLPPVSGNYILHVQADRGSVLAVNGVNVINQWSSGTSPLIEYATTALAFSAGVPVNVRLDYRESATTLNTSSIRFSWTPPGGPKAVIPVNAFTCDSSIAASVATPVLTGEPFAFALRNAPFSYQVSSSPAAATYAADGLPAGLTIDPVTGLISGSTTAPAGLVVATVSGTNQQGTGTLTVPILVLDSGGGLLREVWTGLTGSGIASVPQATPPSSITPITSLEAPADAGDAFGDRMRGFLTAPASGNYTFFLTGDETAAFWLSSSDEPGHRLKRSWVTNSGLAPGSWSTLPGQRSLQVRLKAGQRYYFEALRRETNGPDHLSIGWLQPGQTGTSPAGIIPGWAISPYVAPASSTPDGTLYIANMTPQAGASSLGTGSAILRVNAAKTSAQLTFTYGNLTGPILSRHLHDSRPAPGPAAAIIFDIDDEMPDASGIRHWHFAATGNHGIADVIASIEAGSCYINLHTNVYPNGEIKGFFQPAVGSQFFTPPPAPPAAELALPDGAAAKKSEIVRFLQQATFGARADSDGAPAAGATAGDPFGGYDPDSIEAVQTRGYAAWLDDQLAMDPGPDPEAVVMQPLLPGTVYAGVSSARRRPNSDSTFYNGSGPLSTFIKNYYQRYPRTGPDPDGAVTESAAEIWRAWWKFTCTAPTQVRHRMAFALSQIMVVSEDGPLDEKARAVAHYYDLLYYHGLGNFRTLLERVTLNPGMGKYLDMLGNRKPNPAIGYIPNENYAREILQLFSVGLKRLHPDGTLILDANGLPLPTYGQDNVVGYAHTFTGWTYGTGGSANFVSPMTVRTGDHDTGEKLLLENAVLPANFSPSTVSCDAELKASHELIFQHPNVGPFLCRQLIQRLVTANPSPGYIYRAASAFDDNGSGVRGDLKAVVRAILLDPEARNQAPRLQPGFGKLKEPVLRATQFLRAFRAYSHAESTWADSIDLGTAIFSPNKNINLAVPLRTADAVYSNPTETITSSWIDDEIDPDGAGIVSANTTFNFVVAPGNFLLLRRQTAPPAGGLVIDANGDTNSPENGLYLFSGNGMLLTRALQADTPAELNNAWVVLTTCRMDAPGTPGGSTSSTATNGGSLTGNRYYQQTAAITILGTDPVKWSLSGNGNNFRRLWDVGSTRTPFQQTPLQAPTVFNFYEPDYVFLGNTGNAGLYGPEFQISNETSVITTVNWFNDLVRPPTGAFTTASANPLTYGQGYNYGGSTYKEVKLNLTTERSLAGDTNVLLDHLTTLLLPGQMSPRLRSLLYDYLNPMAGATDANKMTRVTEALYLISLCPEFAIQK